MVFKIESWNFQNQFEKEFLETSQSINSIRKNRKNDNNNCLNKLNELKFCGVSRNSISMRCWKFKLSILKNEKKYSWKKHILSRTAKIDPKDGVSHLNFQWRFWYYLRQEIKNKVSGILRYRSRMVKFCLKLSIKFHVLI